jgi:hypothetical protein
LTISFFELYSNFNFKNELFSTLGDKMENKVRKANLTENIYVIIFLKIRQAKLGNKSDEAMKRCDEALNDSLLQFFCLR